jgi:hypothetical protein
MDPTTRATRRATGDARHAVLDVVGVKPLGAMMIHLLVERGMIPPRDPVCEPAGFTGHPERMPASATCWSIAPAGDGAANARPRPPRRPALVLNHLRLRPVFPPGRILAYQHQCPQVRHRRGGGRGARTDIRSLVTESPSAAGLRWMNFGVAPERG